VEHGSIGAMNPTTTARDLAATVAAESREILRLLDHAQDYIITSMAEEAKNEISTSPFLILKNRLQLILYAPDSL